MKKATTILRPAGWLICGLASLLAGCSSLDGVPREAGLYAVEHDVPTRLDGDPQWERETWEERSNFSPGVSFLIRDSQLATGSPEQLIQLHKVGWVRSEITPAGEIQPRAGSQWANARIEELRVAVQLSRHDDHKDVIRVTPLGALTPGLHPEHAAARRYPGSLRRAVARGRSPGIRRGALRGPLSGEPGKVSNLCGTGPGDRQSAAQGSPGQARGPQPARTTSPVGRQGRGDQHLGSQLPDSPAPGTTGEPPGCRHQTLGVPHRHQLTGTGRFCAFRNPGDKPTAGCQRCASDLRIFPTLARANDRARQITPAKY